MINLNKIVVGALLFAQFPIISAAAEQQCLSGKPGNNHLITQLAQAKSKSAITSQITQKYNLEDAPPEQKPATGCSTCQQGPGNEALSSGNLDTAHILRLVAPDALLLLKTDCLEVSSKVDAPTTELKCPEGKLSSKYNFCFDSNLMRYQNAVITDFYKCMKKLTNLPITPAGLFEMYSLESGFKPHYAYSGGVGLGQLTGVFVDDINQKHRGLNILKSVAHSEDPACAIAKQIASKDVKKPVRLKNNRCSFVQYGEGMERNVLYTLVGLANSWSKDIEPAMGNYTIKHQNDPSIERAKELALMNGYGPGGRAAARAAVRRLTKLNPTQFVKTIQKPMYGTKGTNITTYIGKMQKRQSQLLADMSAGQRDAYQKNGARSCVNQ